jgi:hypothetical protein
MRRSLNLPISFLLYALFASSCVPALLFAQGGLVPVPPRAEGDGPFDRLILHGAILIDGTGAIKLSASNEVSCVGGVSYTIKDGIVYDARKLLADVRKMVQDAAAKENFEFAQPEMKKVAINK